MNMNPKQVFNSDTIIIIIINHQWKTMNAIDGTIYLKHFFFKCMVEVKKKFWFYSKP